MAEPIEIVKRSLVRRSSDRSILDYGKLPPQSKELEEAVLGAIMIDGRAIYEVINILSWEMFYIDAHQRICKAILDLHQNKTAIDILTVTEQLKQNGELDHVGGPFFVSQLSNKVGSFSNIEHHCKMIQEYYIRRMLISEASQMVKDGYEDTVDVFDLMDNHEKAYREIQRALIAGKVETTRDVVLDAAIRIAEMARNPVNSRTILSKHHSFNKNFGGWRRGSVNVVAARTAMGKSAFHADELMWCVEKGYKCYSFNLEMTPEQMVLRCLCNLTNIPNVRYNANELAGDEMDTWQQAMETLSNQPNLRFDFTGGTSIDEIEMKVKRVKSEFGLDLIFVDHLQFIQPSSREKAGNRDIEIGQITRKLKALAKNEDVAIVLFCHIGRAAENNSNKRPTLKDLRESGNIENDCDRVLFLVRPEYYFERNNDGSINYKDETERAYKNICQVHCDKNRDGYTFSDEFKCYLGTNRFEDVNGPPVVRTVGASVALPVKDRKSGVEDELPF